MNFYDLHDVVKVAVGAVDLEEMSLDDDIHIAAAELAFSVKPPFRLLFLGKVEELTTGRLHGERSPFLEHQK